MSVTHNIKRTSVSRTEAALSHAASAFSLLINRLDWSKVNPLQVPLEVVIEAEREVIAASYASRAESAALRAAVAEAEKQRDELVEAGSKAADDLARIGEFHTAGAWLWSNLDRSRPEFEEAEWRRKRAEEIKDDLWKVLDKHIPDDGAST